MLWRHGEDGQINLWLLMEFIGFWYFLLVFKQWHLVNITVSAAGLVHYISKARETLLHFRSH